MIQIKKSFSPNYGRNTFDGLEEEGELLSFTDETRDIPSGRILVEGKITTIQDFEWNQTGNQRAFSVFERQNGGLRISNGNRVWVL